MDSNISRRDFPAGSFSVLCPDVPVKLLLGRSYFQRASIVEITSPKV